MGTPVPPSKESLLVSEVLKTSSVDARLRLEFFFERAFKRCSMIVFFLISFILALILLLFVFYNYGTASWLSFYGLSSPRFEFKLALWSVSVFFNFS